jgi:catechol 2,3-dioxygenase-like lactoylglutathione lyase family enzyme
MISISHIDHLVLTVKDIPTTLEFYARVLGMHAIQFGNLNDQAPRIALKFGDQKINLHESGKELEPKAHNAVPGSADLCLITEADIEKAMQYISACKVDIIEGPVKRTGATGELLSFYIRDPDLNLIEISNQVN